jgi:hypothetical protein
LYIVSMTQCLKIMQYCLELLNIWKAESPLLDDLKAMSLNTHVV